MCRLRLWCWLPISLFLHAAIGHAEELQLCLRGKTFEPGREFLQTRRVKVHLDGPPAGDLLPALVSRAAREKLWPQLRTDEVLVAPFDKQVCGGEPMAELSLRMDSEDLAAVALERSRGPGEQPSLNAIAKRASARPAPPRLPPPDAAANARRHDWMRVYFATTRKATGLTNATAAFGAERSDALSFGSVQVSIPAEHRLANLESPSLLRLEWDADPNRHIVLAEPLEVLPRGAWSRAVARKAGEFDKAGVLLFVHGYNNSFAEAAQRAAQLAYDLGFPGPIVLFSWPSDGDVLAYMRDEQKALTAWRQMAEVLGELTRLGTGIQICVVAHSMGTRVLTQGMAELLRSRPGADRAFRQVVLASPDIGEEEFRERWVFELKSANAPRFTLYASNQDLPAAVSAWLHGERRLGSGGEGIVVLPQLDSVDASGITREWFGLSHSFFGDNATVMSDLFLVINQGLEPGKRPRLKKASGSRGAYWEFRK